MDVNKPSLGSKATRREWIGLAVLALPCILATMDLTVLTLAVPHLTEELKPSTSQLLWIMDMYGFWIAGSLITMGTLGDRIGRRKVLLIGAAAFGISSMLAAFSKSASLLIFTRALLGVAGATLAPSTLSLIRNMFHDDQERTFAIGVWVTCFSVGATIGPVLGGILLEHFWWGSVFLLNVPVMVLLLILGPLLLPEFKDPNAGRLDVLSAAMSLCAVLPVIYGLKKFAEHGFEPTPVLSILIGVAFGIAFTHRQKRLSDPLIDLNLFRSPPFSASLALNSFGCFVAFGAFFFTAQYLQLVLGLTPLQAGLWSMPSSVAFTVGSMLTPQLVKRVRPGTLIAGGLILAAGGFALLGAVPPANGLPMLVTALAVYSLGISPIFTLSTDLIIAAAPPEKAGAAASVSETSTEFGGALGLAILGSVGTALYRSQVTKILPPDLPADAAQAVRGTLGGALAVAQQSAPEIGAAILSSARTAFTHALQMTGLINVAITLLLAALALAVLNQPAKH